jgi:hypothetical protein
MEIKLAPRPESVLVVSHDGQRDVCDAAKAIRALDDMFSSEDDPRVQVLLESCRIFAARIQELEETNG